MSENISSKYTFWLWPFSFLYGIGVFIRNQLFDWGIKKEKVFPVPVICVGNLAVGGTGKTPHVEYLVRLLKDKYRIAVVSRGYKRSSKGFILATKEHTCKEIGDEPYQIFHKYPEILVAVDGNRCRAIDKLLSLPDTKKPQVILLDDAYQHRYVKPSFSILLTDYGRMFYNDRLLPVGRLREPISGCERADAVIVTKTPRDLKPIEYRITETNMQLKAHQQIFFSYVEYDRICSLQSADRTLPFIPTSDDVVLVVSGIANPKYFVSEVRKSEWQVEEMIFSDHHDFKESDIRTITQSFQRLKGRNKIILTTEKDAVLLLHNKYVTEELKGCIYYLPISISFSEEEKDSFDNMILKHIQTFQQNKILW